MDGLKAVWSQRFSFFLTVSHDWLVFWLPMLMMSKEASSRTTLTELLPSTARPWSMAQTTSSSLSFAVEKSNSTTAGVDVSMRNYSLNTKKIQIDRIRRQQLESSLTEEEFQVYQSGAGELGWLTRQLRCDLCYENGVVQRAKGDACVADLVKLRQYLSMAQRGADFCLRYWSDVDLRNGVLIHLVDSGHANGSHEKDDRLPQRGWLFPDGRQSGDSGREECPSKLSFHSGQAKRVCRLAAEASHLAEAIEAGDWCCCLWKKL